MSPARFNEVLRDLGDVSRRDLARRVSWIGHDGKEVSRWRTGAETIPNRLGEWLEELWAVRDDEEALEQLWNRPPPGRNDDPPPEDEPLMAREEFNATLTALDITSRDLERMVSWLEQGEAAAWRRGEEPVEESVARWLRALLAAQGDEEETARLRRRPPPQPLPGVVRYQRMSKEMRDRLDAERRTAGTSDFPEEEESEPDPKRPPRLDEIL